MIVWINGAFGAGKSTVTDELRKRRPELRLFDPEYVGFMLRHFMDVPTGDFQDLPLWRRLVVETARGLVKLGPLVVPMTLLVPAYRTEIFDGLRSRGVTLHHVVLRVSESTLRARIDGDVELADAREWRHSHVPRALSALSGLAGAIEVANEGRDAAATADEIAARMA